VSKTAVPELASVADAAAATGMHPSSIRKRLVEGRSDAYRIGRDWFFTDAQLAQLRKDAKPHRKRKNEAAVRLNPDGDAGPSTTEGE
jgi:hypothetical protein